MKSKVIVGAFALCIVVSGLFLLLPAMLAFVPVLVLLTGTIAGGLMLIRTVRESNDEDEAVLEDRARDEHSHAETVERELKTLRKQQDDSATDLKTRIAELQQAKDKATSDRKRLLNGLKDAGTAESNAGMTMILENVKHLADKASESEHAEHCHDDAEIEELSEELTAAEELLREVEQQRAELEKQVKDSSAEMFKLKATVESATRKSNDARARTLMLTSSNVKKTDIIAKRMEDMLKGWIKKEDLNVNFSEHSHAVDVQRQFERLDQDFVARYFTHVTNPEL